MRLEEVRWGKGRREGRGGGGGGGGGEGGGEGGGDEGGEGEVRVEVSEGRVNDRGSEFGEDVVRRGMRLQL